MKRVLDNATILYGPDLETVRGHIVLKDGVIEKVGEGSYVGPKEDLKGGIISPSFTNAHAHVGDSAGKDKGSYRSIGERVGKGGIKYEIHNRSDVKAAILHTLRLMKKTGTTALCDFREGGAQGVELLREMLNMPARILGRPNGDLDIMAKCDGLGISSIKDYDEEKLKKMLKKRKGKLVGVHAAEVKDDVAEVLKINPDFVVHLTNATSEGLKNIFKRGIPIVLCPRANASFGVGVADLRSIFKSQCLVALGTDNVMANSTSMLREMEFTWKLYRAVYKDPAFHARTVLKAATINGRRLLKLSDNSIKEGNPADFIVFRKLPYSQEPTLAIVHRAGAHDIREVIAPSSPFPTG